MTDHTDLQKRCQRGATNLADANNLLAECYGMLGAMSIENEALRKDKSEQCDACFMAEAESLRKDAALGRVATKYIYRLCDPAECDPLEKIVEEYVAAFSAAMSKEG